MQEQLARFVSDPAWWISVVFVSLLVGLLCIYLVRFIDRVFEKLSQKRQEKRERQNAAVRARMDEMMINAHARRYRSLVVVREFLISGFYAVGFIFVCIWAGSLLGHGGGIFNIPIGVGGVYFFYSYLTHFVRAIDLLRELTTVEMRLSVRESGVTATE